MWDENVLKEQTERGYVCPNASCCKCDGGGVHSRKKALPTPKLEEGMTLLKAYLKGSGLD